MMSPSEARWFAIAGAALGGLVIGSFLNVVVYRAPRHLSVVRPGSFCPRCSTPLRAVDNVPVVSWMLLRGRCRTCAAPISPRYPVVEAGTGLLFAAIAAAVGPHPAAVGLCLAAAGATASLAIELDGEPLPPAVPVVASGLGLAALAAASGLDGHWAHLAGATVGTLAGAAVGAAVGTLVRKGPAAWALVPAGTVIGWCEPAGAAVGAVILVAGIGLLAVAGVRRGSRPSEGRSPGEERRSPARRLGPAAIALSAAAASVVAALAAGTGLS